jgi:hypothetical protein
LRRNGNITLPLAYLDIIKHLRPIKTQKQVSDGVPHSQREQAPPTMLLTVVKHMATLVQGLQISQPVIGGVMVNVGSGQHYRGRANRETCFANTTMC